MESFVENCAEHQADADPDLAHAKREDGAGKAHQQPAAHVGGLRAHRGDPGTHGAAAEEIVLFAGAAVADEEKQADADYQHEIEYKRK